jgi:hypothetical protein
MAVWFLRTKTHIDLLKKYCLGIKKLGNVRFTPSAHKVGGPKSAKSPTRGDQIS